MLKNIPDVFSPELLKTLMEMGHGDEIIIADGNFPSYSQGCKTIQANGHNVQTLLEAILTYFPLDTYSDNPVVLMKVDEDDLTVPIVWDTFKEIIKYNEYKLDVIKEISKPEFYDRAKKAYAIIATSDKALYANILLKKGVV